MILPVLLNPAHLIGAPEVIAVGWLGLPFFLGGSLAGLLAIRTRTVVLAIPRARIRQIQVFTVTTFTSSLWIHPAVLSIILDRRDLCRAQGEKPRIPSPHSLGKKTNKRRRLWGGRSPKKIPEKNTIFRPAKSNDFHFDGDTNRL